MKHVNSYDTITAMNRYSISYIRRVKFPLEEERSTKGRFNPQFGDESTLEGLLKTTLVASKSN